MGVEITKDLSYCRKRTADTINYRVAVLQNVIRVVVFRISVANLMIFPLNYIRNFKLCHRLSQDFVWGALFPQKS